MEKKMIIVIHNSLEKKSRDFVNSLTQNELVIDWHNNGFRKEVLEYINNDNPEISSFPSVVDTEKKIICVDPTSMQNAIKYINSYEINEKQKSRELKLSELRSLRNIKLTDVDNMINDIVLGKRNDVELVSKLRDDLLKMTDSYKKEDGKASEVLDTCQFNDIVWPEIKKA